jgi:protein phosphatase
VTIAIDCFGLTDPGRVRPNNEDQFLVADLGKSLTVLQSSLPGGDHANKFGVAHGKLLVVADGMGGVEGGEVASGLAVRTVSGYVLHAMPWFFRVEDGREGELEGELKTALEACQRKVEAAQDDGHRRMGTTLTMAYLSWPRLYVVHAGDSRCYLARGGRLHQITRDHTLAQKMVERGVLSAEQADSSRWSHVLYNCIGGGGGHLDPEVYKAVLRPGDTVLLCTDGLGKYVADGDVLGVLDRTGSAEDAARELVAAANAAGGDDNVTVVVARIREADETTNLSERA